MKIIVVSDTHGSYRNLRKVVLMHKNADLVVHCGDSRGEMADIKMKYPDKMYYEVRGNWAYVKTTSGTGGYVKASSLKKAK